MQSMLLPVVYTYACQGVARKTSEGHGSETMCATSHVVRSQVMSSSVSPFRILPVVYTYACGMLLGQRPKPASLSSWAGAWRKRVMTYDVAEHASLLSTRQQISIIRAAS